MGSTGSIWVSLGLKTDNFQKGVKNARGGLGKFKKDTNTLQSSLRSLGGVMAGVFAAGSIVSFAKSSVAAYDEQIQAQKKLENALGFTSTALQKQASELQKVTRFGDEATMQMQAQLATLGLTEKQIHELTPLVQDLSAQTGKSLTKSAKEVTSALSTGSTTLAKYGVDLSATNSLAENFDLTIKGLEDSVGGAAQLMAGEGSGGIDQLSNAFGDLQESVGKVIVEALQPLVKHLKEATEQMTALADDKTLNWWEKLAGTINSSAGAAISKYNQMINKAVTSQKDLSSTQEVATQIANNLDKALKDGTISKGEYLRQVANLKLAIDDAKDSFKPLSEESTHAGNEMSSSAKKAAKEFENLLKKVEKAEEGFDEMGAFDEGLSIDEFKISNTAAQELANELNDIELPPLEIPELDADPALAKLKAKNEGMRMIGEGMGDALSSGLQGAAMEGLSALGELLGSGDLAQFGQAFIGAFSNLLKSFGEQMIQLGLGMLALKAALALGPLGAGLAIAGGVALIAIASAINGQMQEASTGFAQGGLVTGSVFGNVGEGAGTTKSNPELIMPVDRLQKFLDVNSGGMNGDVTFRIEGSQLVGILKRMGKNNRFSS